MAAGSSHEILRLCWLEAIILCLRPNTFQHSASTVSSELALSDLYLDVRCKCFCIILSLTLAFWPDHLPCLTLCVSDFRLQPVETYNPEMASLVGNLKTAITMTMRLTSVCCAQPETHWQTLATGSVPVVPVSVTVRLPVACPDTAVRGLRRAAARQKHFVVAAARRRQAAFLAVSTATQQSAAQKEDAHLQAWPRQGHLVVATVRCRPEARIRQTFLATSSATQQSAAHREEACLRAARSAPAAWARTIHLASPPLIRACLLKREL